MEYIKSDIEWSNRWDLYLRSDPNAQIHWFSILNSTCVIRIIFMILLALNVLCLLFSCLPVFDVRLFVYLVGWF